MSEGSLVGIAGHMGLCNMGSLVSLEQTDLGYNGREEDKKLKKEDHRYTPPPRIFISYNQQQSQIKISREEEGFRKAAPFKRYPTPRYQTIFIGLCYSCNNFGHKDVNCKDNRRNINNYEGYIISAYSRRPNEMQRRNYDKIESLSTEVE